MTGQTQGKRAIAPFSSSVEPKDRAGFQGLLFALAIMGLWGTSLSYCLAISLSNAPAGHIALAILWQAFLYTGLFITAHDAMHGSVCPSRPRINHFIGQFTLLAYALFPYQELLQKHWQHHRAPASKYDPDFHNGVHTHIVAWYLTFMQRYVTWPQAVQLIALYCALHWVLQIPQGNLLLFWILPIVLSSLQLFYFGTFRPHHEPEMGYSNGHRAETYPMPMLWSFLTCYHFGYHREHHEYPQVPWWQLPIVYQRQLESPHLP